MKKIILSVLMLMFATSAFATEKAFVLEPLYTGSRYAEPCPQYPEEGPVPANGYCSEGMVCPIGFDPVAKYCFRGGFHRCGIACRSNGMYDN